MKKYIVCLSTGEQVRVEAEDFDVNFSLRRVMFSADGKNIAVFNFDNIQGFYQEYASKEKGQSK